MVLATMSLWWFVWLLRASRVRLADLGFLWSICSWFFISKLGRGGLSRSRRVEFEFGVFVGDGKFLKHSWCRASLLTFHSMTRCSGFESGSRPSIGAPEVVIPTTTEIS